MRQRKTRKANGHLGPLAIEFSHLIPSSVLLHDFKLPGDDFIEHPVVSVGIHIPTALEATGDVDDGSAGDGFQIRDVLSFPGGNIEPGGFDDVGPVVPIVGKFGDDGEAA